jgi:hypothetical protein
MLMQRAPRGLSPVKALELASGADFGCNQTNPVNLEGNKFAEP